MIRYSLRQREQLGQALRRARVQAKMSYETVAAVFGVGGSTWFNWQGGRFVPAKDKWPVIKSILGVDVKKVLQKNG